MTKASAPIVVCVGCGKPVSIWMPMCPECQAELAPAVGEKMRDAMAERAIATLADNEKNE